MESERRHKGYNHTQISISILWNLFGVFNQCFSVSLSDFCFRSKLFLFLLSFVKNVVRNWRFKYEKAEIQCFLCEILLTKKFSCSLMFLVMKSFFLFLCTLCWIFNELTTVAIGIIHIFQGSVIKVNQNINTVLIRKWYTCWFSRGIPNVT